MIQIKQINKKDFNTARKFALEGMHFNQYTNNKIALYFYSKYFWYLELSRATKALGAYDNNKLAGVLLAEVYSQPPVFQSIWYKIFIKFAAFVIDIFCKDAVDVYDNTNEKMLKTFKARNKTQGEIICFAVDPKATSKGIGTLLLNELERQEEGKTMHLFTDSNCTYQFYLHRGFNQIDKREISIALGGNNVPLSCFLFSKTFGKNSSFSNII